MKYWVKCRHLNATFGLKCLTVCASDCFHMCMHTLIHESFHNGLFL